MKNWTKILGLGLMIAPCALAFTACGSGMVDTSGKYEAIDKATVVQETEQFDTHAILNGFKIVTKTDMKMGGKKAKSEITIHCAGQNMSMKMKIDKKDYMSIYYKDGTAYMETMGIKYQTTKDMDFDDITSAGGNGFISEQIDFQGLLDNLSTIQDQTKCKIEKATKGTAAKYHISIAGDALSNEIVGDINDIIPGSNVSFGEYNFWVVFENNTFTGLKTTISATASYLGQDISMNVSLELAGVTGAIEYPDDLASYPTQTPNIPNI